MISIGHDIHLAKGSPGMFLINVGPDKLNAEQMRELAYAILAIVKAHSDE